MSAISIKDSPADLPLLTGESRGDEQKGAAPVTAESGQHEPDAPTSPARKARTKRPRPTFDDGALTRVFKFPSKSYPRSSFYVTADEIIIRIKKGKSKWKLVVPKKRVVSYRTNRWFTKPRFVELELTFTQASRLKLVAPRAKPKDEPADGVAVEPTAESTQALVGVGQEAAMEKATADDLISGGEASAELSADAVAGSETGTDSDEHDAEDFVEGPSDDDETVLELGAELEDGEAGWSDADETGRLDAESAAEAGEAAAKLVACDADAADLATRAVRDWDEPVVALWDDAACGVLACPMFTTGAPALTGEAFPADEQEAGRELSPDAAMSDADAEVVAEVPASIAAGNLAAEVTPSFDALRDDVGDAIADDAAEIETFGGCDNLAVPYIESSIVVPAALVPGVVQAEARESEKAEAEPQPQLGAQRDDETAFALPEAVAARPPKPARKSATLGAVAVTMTLAAAVVTWLSLAETFEPQTASVACARQATSPECGGPVVTGSIVKAIEPPAAEAVTKTAFEAPPQAKPALPERIEIDVPDMPAEKSIETAVQDDTSPKVAVQAEPPPPPSLPQPQLQPDLKVEVATPEPVLMSSAPVIVAADAAPQPTAEQVKCRALGVAAKSLQIRFDYASARLDPAAVAAIVDVAGRLGSCAVASVIIEGHTDSDGDSDRNQALSVRRAQTVWEQLVAAGAKPEQLSVIGFGFSRPEAPNDTVENKLRNRRVVLVVELPK